MSVLGATLVAALLALSSPAAAQLPAPPVVGTGPFQLGGYGAITFSRVERPDSIQGTDVSELAAALLAWGQITPRASYLVELDMAKRNSDTWTGRETSQTLSPVRVYVEYTASDLFRLRAGRFLTPVGQWNELHAEPLTWTPNRPLTTYRPFAKSLNGVLAAGEGSLGGHDVGYAVFWAPSLNLKGGLDEAEESSFVSAVGARLAAEVHPGLTLGVSAASMRRSHPIDEEAYEDHMVPFDGEFADDDGEADREEDMGHRTLVGADLRWVTPNLEISAEGSVLPAYADEPRESGAFVLGAFRLHGPVWGVARAEVYQPVNGRTARTAFAGLTVRANRHLVVKFGRQFSRQPSIKIPDGWFLSFSSLF